MRSLSPVISLQAKSFSMVWPNQRHFLFLSCRCKDCCSALSCYRNPRGEELSYIKMTGVFVAPLRGEKKMVLYLLRCRSSCRTCYWALLGYWAKKYDRDNVLKLVPLRGLGKHSSNAHKTGVWYFALRRSFWNFRLVFPFFFYMGAVSAGRNQGNAGDILHARGLVQANQGPSSQF